MVTRVPGLDTPAAFRRTGAVPITDMARSFDRRQPVVVINTRTHKRQLIWSEIDANPAKRSDVTLIVRPGRNLDENTRYVVALRRLKDARGRTLEARRAFRVFRDRLPSRSRAVEPPPRAHGADLPRPPARGHPAPQPVPRLGLHGRQRAQPHRRG